MNLVSKNKEFIEEGSKQIESEQDIIKVRRIARKISKKMGFGVTDITRIVTATSELARNIYQYAGEGKMTWRVISSGGKRGLELTFKDHGEGIPDIDMAMKKGYSTSKGLGLGLPGAKRLMDEMKLWSKPGEGTRITVRKWL